MQKSPTMVNCPTCQELVPWDETSKYRPFCSERCKLIDFGDWAAEKHAIPAEESFDNLGMDVDKNNQEEP